MLNKNDKFVTGKTEKEVKEKLDKDRPNMEGLKISGGLKLTGRDKNGKVKFVKQQKNLITNGGYDFICDVIGLTSQPVEIAYMALSNGAVGDATATALAATETHRVAAVYAHTPGTKTFTLTSTFTDVVAAISYGCLNAAADGTLLNIAGFSSISVDSLEIVATLTLS